MMTVLIVGPDRRDLGGVSNYLKTVLPNLSNPGIELRYLEVGSTKNVARFMHPIVDQLRLWRELREHAPDIVHLNPSLNIRSFIRDGAFLYTAKIHKVRALVFFHGWRTDFEHKLAGPLKWFFNRTYRRADSFVVLAERFAGKLYDWGVRSPVFVTTTAVANDMLERFVIEDKVRSIATDNPIRLLFLARLVPEKGVLQLVEAVRILRDKRVPVTLTIAGDGPLMNEVCVAIAQSPEIHDCIKTVGYVRGAEKIAIFTSHHVFCLPTENEGMPISLLEAMAFGMPIVTCPAGGISDFFDDENMGILLAENDPSLMARSICRLLADRAKLAEISKYNFDYAQQNFLASEMAKTLMSFYRKTLNSATK
jgi:glycosyltransferase involved in cell wall biosynthesis